MVTRARGAGNRCSLDRACFLQQLNMVKASVARKELAAPLTALTGCWVLIRAIRVDQGGLKPILFSRYLLTPNVAPPPAPPSPPHPPIIPTFHVEPWRSQREHTDRSPHQSTPFAPHLFLPSLADNPRPLCRHQNARENQASMSSKLAGKSREQSQALTLATSNANKAELERSRADRARGEAEIRALAAEKAAAAAEAVVAEAKAKAERDVALAREEAASAALQAAEARNTSGIEG